MIVFDTSALISYLQGENGWHTQHIENAIDSGAAALPPVVITELLSDSTQQAMVRSFVKKLKTLEPKDGFWERAGLMRAKLKMHKLKARTADALIAQSCIDYHLPLLTLDSDFRNFAKHGGLKLVKP